LDGQLGWSAWSRQRLNQRLCDEQNNVTTVMLFGNIGCEPNATRGLNIRQQATVGACKTHQTNENENGKGLVVDPNESVRDTDNNAK
jgi:hypothetical protein